MKKISIWALGALFCALMSMVSTTASAGGQDLVDGIVDATKISLGKEIDKRFSYAEAHSHYCASCTTGQFADLYGTAVTGVFCSDRSKTSWNVGPTKTKNRAESVEARVVYSHYDWAAGEFYSFEEYASLDSVNYKKGVFTISSASYTLKCRVIEGGYAYNSDGRSRWSNSFGGSGGNHWDYSYAEAEQSTIIFPDDPSAYLGTYIETNSDDGKASWK